MKRIRKAFTIAEIFIAMMVMGGIAMILMPVLLSDSSEQVLDTSLSKTYSMFQQTARSVGLLAARGKITISDPTYTFFQTLSETAQTVNTMDFSNGSIVTETETDLESAITKRRMKINLDTSSGDKRKEKIEGYLDGYVSDISGLVPATEANTIVLKNGVFVMLGAASLSDPTTYVIIDVNGKRSPNKVGKDIFYFEVKEQGASNSIMIEPALGACDMDSSDIVDKIGCARKKIGGKKNL